MRIKTLVRLLLHMANAIAFLFDQEFEFAVYYACTWARVAHYVLEYPHPVLPEQLV